MWTEKMAEKFDQLKVKEMELKEYSEENEQWRNVAEILIKDIGEKIEEEILQRKKTIQKNIENIRFEDVDEVLAKVCKTADDKNVYLALDTVGNLKEEVSLVLTRITDAKALKKSHEEELLQARQSILEVEQKMAEVTDEYQTFVRQ